ncbi:MAG: ribonuclease P protein component [bacterium]|nr:ribonuclease P protein component [bacterium]
MALPRGKRLKNAGDFRSVFRSNAGAKAGTLLLKAKPASKESSRFGIVISKRVSKKAVERNRLRRLLGEALKKEQPSLPGPHDIVLVALPGFSVHSLKEAQDIVSQLFVKAFQKKSPQ